MQRLPIIVETVYTVILFRCFVMMSVFIYLEMYTIGPAVEFKWSLKSQFTPKSKVLVFFLPVILFMHQLFWCEQLSFKDIG